MKLQTKSANYHLFDIAKFSIYFSLCLCLTNVKAELYDHQLQFQPAADAIVFVQPHISAETTLSTKNNLLIVNGSKQDNEKVTRLLQLFDVATRQYKIEVRILDHPMKRITDSQTVITRSERLEEIKVIRYQLQSTDRNNHFYEIRALENQQAFVSTGESFPDNQIQDQYSQLLPSTGKTNIANGFYIIVTAQGEQQILISVSAQQQTRQYRYGQTIASSSTSTKARATIDQWALVASTSRDSQLNNTKRYRTSSLKAKQRWYYVRVNEV